MASEPSSERDRLIVDIPRPLYDTALSHAQRADNMKMTRYFHIGHRVLYGLSTIGAFSSPNAMIRMYDQMRPLPLQGLVPNLAGPQSEATKRMVLELPMRMSQQADQLVQAGPVRTRTAYAITNLNLLNGLVAMRDSIDESLDLKFQIVSAVSDEQPDSAEHWVMDL